MAKANDQTRLASGSSPTQVRQEIALGVYGTAVPTLPRVALLSPRGSFIAVNDRCAAMMLTWPWWSVEGLLVGAHRIGHSKKKEVLIFVETPK